MPRGRAMVGMSPGAAAQVGASRATGYGGATRPPGLQERPSTPQKPRRLSPAAEAEILQRRGAGHPRGGVGAPRLAWARCCGGWATAPRVPGPRVRYERAQRCCDTEAGPLLARREAHHPRDGLPGSTCTWPSTHSRLAYAEVRMTARATPWPPGARAGCIAVQAMTDPIARTPGGSTARRRPAARPTRPAPMARRASSDPAAPLGLCLRLPCTAPPGRWYKPPRLAGLPPVSRVSHLRQYHP